MKERLEYIRIHQFDYIRVISLLGILVCHSCYCFATTDWLGRYFGLTFNFLFLTLSALLFGISWNNKGCVSYKRDFLRKRFAKLSKSYYPYLVILFLFLYLTEDSFSWKHVITHFLYLPWFDKIEGFGHLWFLTMIAICYIGIYIISHFELKQYYNILIASVLMGGGYLIILLTSTVAQDTYFPIPSDILLYSCIPIELSSK